MNKDKKEELKKLFSIIDDKKFLRFAKSYASKDDGFADAIIEHFLPEDKPIDYKAVIAACFAHRKKGRVSSWKLHYDWAVIRRESKRVMKQLQMMVDGSDYLSAVDGALLFLETLCVYFLDDNFDYDYNTYEGKDFSQGTALSLIRRLMLSSDSELTRQEKLRILERLKRINSQGVIDEYLSGGLWELIDDAQEVLLDDEQMLDVLDERIAAARYDHSKAVLIIKKYDLLKSMNRENDAEMLLNKNMDIEEIRIYDLDRLMAQERYKDAERKCNAYLKEKDSNTKVWTEYKLSIGEKTDDKELICPALQWLCANARLNNETRREYCMRIKTLCDNDQWLKIREEMIRKMVGHEDNKSSAFWLLKEEGLVERLYGYISNLSIYRDYWDRTVGGELLKYYVPYAESFTVEQQETLEKRVCEVIRQAAGNSKAEKDYYDVRNGIELLSHARPEAHAKAVALRNEMMRLYSRKPLFMSIMNDLKL